MKTFEVVAYAQKDGHKIKIIVSAENADNAMSQARLQAVQNGYVGYSSILSCVKKRS